MPNFNYIDRYGHPQEVPTEMQSYFVLLSDLKVDTTDFTPPSSIRRMEGATFVEEAPNFGQKAEYLNGFVTQKKLDFLREKLASFVFDEDKYSPPKFVMKDPYGDGTFVSKAPDRADLDSHKKVCIDRQKRDFISQQVAKHNADVDRELKRREQKLPASPKKEANPESPKMPPPRLTLSKSGSRKRLI